MLTPAHLLFILSCLIANTLPTTDPFIGTWKFNPDKSTLVDQMHVEPIGANKYLLNLGGGVERIVADGTDQRGLAGTTVSITIQAPDSWTIVRKMNGRPLVRGAWKLSPDGKTLSDHFTQYPDSGAPSSSDYVYARIAGKSGFTGTWEMSVKVATFEYHIEPWARDGLALVNVDARRTQRLKFDGKDYPFTGPGVIAGSASSGRRVDERTLETTEKVQGVISDTRRLTVSSDQTTLTITVRRAGRTKPDILVFDRA